MKPEDQVANLELSRKLYDLGWRLDAHFFWGMNIHREYEVRGDSRLGLKLECEAPTVAELLGVLPRQYPDEKNSELILYCYSGYGYTAVYEDDMRGNMVGNSDETDKKLVDALAAMLIKLTEEGIVKPGGE